MKAEVGELPTGPGWVYELKWDGMRLLLRVEQGEFGGEQIPLCLQ